METMNKRATEIAEQTARDGLALIGLLGVHVPLHAALRVVTAALSLVEVELLKAPRDPDVFSWLICVLERACDTASRVLDADLEVGSHSKTNWRFIYGPKMVELMDLLRMARDDLKEDLQARPTS